MTNKITVAIGVAIVFVAAVLALYAFPHHATPKVSAAAVDYFLKIDGIPGESTATGHENEIDLNSWSWGVTAPRDAATGLATGKRSYQPLVITKNVDKATPQLFLACTNGKAIKQMVLTGRNPQSFDYITYTFSNVTCSSDKQSGQSGNLATEEVTFNYSKVQIVYKQQNSDGSIAPSDSGALDLSN